MSLRRVPVCYNSRNIFTDAGVRSWGDILSILWRQEAALFKGGVDVLVEQLDGKAPRAKEREQARRLQAHVAQRKRELEKQRNGEQVAANAAATRELIEGDVEVSAGNDADEAPGSPLPSGPVPLGSQEPVSTFRWPDEDDGQPWFFRDARPQCSMDDVYYHPIAKRKWYEFVCHFLLYEASIPRGKSLLICCGALAGTMLRRPVMAHVDADGVRTVQELEEHDPYWDLDERGNMVHRTYTEADDRILYWVMHYAPRGHGIMVITEDGDLTPSLMTTYRPRVEALARSGKMGRLLLRRTKHLGKLRDGQNVNEPQMVDIDMLAAHVEMLFTGILTDGATYDGHWEYGIDNSDPVLLFALFALLRKNDYSHELPRLSFTNIIRSAIQNPDLVRRLLHCTPPARYADLHEELSTPEAIQAYLHMPRQVLIQWDAFYKFVHACYREVWRLRPRGIKKDGKPSMRADQSQKQAPVPSDEELRGKCARVSWTLDKMLNGGKRGYVIPPELALSIDTKLPIFGYHEIEIEIEDLTAQHEERRVRKRKIVDDAPRVHPMKHYGVRQAINNNVD